jgi:hypothetical protein
VRRTYLTAEGLLKLLAPGTTVDYWQTLLPPLGPEQQEQQQQQQQAAVHT